MSELPDPETFGDYGKWPGRHVDGPGGHIGNVPRSTSTTPRTARSGCWSTSTRARGSCRYAGARIDAERSVVVHGAGAR